MPEDITLPESLPYTATAESGHHMRRCDYCEQPERQCRRYVLRFPEDQAFIDWETGKDGKNRTRGLRVCYVPTKTKEGGTIDGCFCSEECALKSYFPIYCIWRLRGET